jgi:hypothetical protein
VVVEVGIYEGLVRPSEIPPLRRCSYTLLPT